MRWMGCRIGSAITRFNEMIDWRLFIPVAAGFLAFALGVRAQEPAARAVHVGVLTTTPPVPVLGEVATARRRDVLSQAVPKRWCRCPGPGLDHCPSSESD